MHRIATTLALTLLLAAVGATAQSFDAELAPLAADAASKGCDMLDPSHCLYPWPSDHFTEAAPTGSPQASASGGTGRRVALQTAAMPRNAWGKPVDPTELNRNDGFSPGQMIVTYIPGLRLTETYQAPEEQIGVADIRKTVDPDGPILVLRVEEDASGNITDATPHLAWAELDATAAVLTRSGADQGSIIIDYPTDSPVALMIRPAINYEEGGRYVVVLRNLRDGNGEPIEADTAFRVCRDDITTLLPELQARCTHLDQKVFPVLEKAQVSLDDTLHSAWDFTVASTNSQVGRVRAMRDEAFASLEPVVGSPDCTIHVDGNGCAVPAFTIEQVLEAPDVEGGIYRQIHGTITVPSFVTPVDPSPLEDPAIQAALIDLEAQFPQEFSDLFEVGGIGSSVSAPPNRLFYDPSDQINPADPQGAPYGDGLPDSIGTMTRPFICQIPDVALTRGPSRAGIYGHGLLDSRSAITYDGVDDISREHNYMFCAVDSFGFSTGDIGNVATALLDVSFFPVIPDASQQGFVIWAFLVRAMRHEAGLATHAAFQDAQGDALFDRSEVFYDGNSQGGILGGAVMAVSKDVTRGILGSLGANYSLLLRRSKDFDLYSVPFYLSYPNQLDRNFLFSTMQMLWDRGENNAYVPHIVDNTALGGPDNTVLLHPMFGDHEVTMWSADVMARTMSIPANYDMVERTRVRLGQGKRHPDMDPGYALTPLDFNDPVQAAGSGMVTWDGYTLSQATEIPPIVNLPPRAGRNPHDDSAKRIDGRCHKALFLRSGGAITDPTDLVVDKGSILVDGVACP